MARQLLLVALIFVAMVGMVMGGEAPSPSPKSSQSPSLSPKASPSSSSSPSTSASSTKSAPTPSSSESSSTSPASSPSKEADGSVPPAPSSDPIELYGPGPVPADEAITPEASPAADEANAAASLHLSVVVAAASLAGFFAF